MEASSSLHTNGWWNTKRLTTPASSTPISASTSAAVGSSTAWRSAVSIVPAIALRRCGGLGGGHQARLPTAPSSTPQASVPNFCCHSA